MPKRPKTPAEIKAHYEKMVATVPQGITAAYQIEPASCTDGSYTFDEARKWKEEPARYIYEEKFDGLRYLLQSFPHSRKGNYLTSRRISVQTGNYVEKQDMVPIIRDWEAADIPYDTIFDGEIFSTGLSSDTQHDMVTGNVVYKCWDVLMVRGELLVHLPWFERQNELSMLLKKAAQPWLQQVSVSTHARSLLADVTARKGEGLIRKDRLAPYGVGWAKVKDEIDADVVVTGYEYSKEGKYAKRNWIKGIKFGQLVKLANLWAMREFGQTSGISEKLRAEISAAPEKFIGRPMEIKAQLRLASGKFRHPRFSRWRDDKNPSDCKFVKARSIVSIAKRERTTAT